MKTLAAVSMIAILAVSGCSEAGSITGLNGPYPPWLGELVLQFQNAPVGNPPQSIWQYRYKGETVYFVPQQCCDQFSVLYDLSGRIMCFPDGGFAGGGDGRCPDFFRERTDEVLVWRDSRTR